MKKTFCVVAVLFLSVAHCNAVDIYYYHEDHLGGASIITDQDGEVVAEYEYYPYGEAYSEEVSEDFSNNYKFTGQEEDAETGLYYYGARYYGSAVARFMSQDPAVYDERLLEMLYDPQSLNPYAYVRNNPIKYVDPSGEEPNKAQAGTVGDILDIISLPNSYSYNANVGMLHKFINYYGKDTGGISMRYVYTEQAGWVDMRHFFYFAEKSYTYGNAIAMTGGYMSEFYQWMGLDIDSMTLGLGSNPSAFSYEDLTSDALGVAFGHMLSEQSGEYSFEELLTKFLDSLGATNPEEAYNYNEIPENSGSAAEKGYNEVDKSY